MNDFFRNVSLYPRFLMGVMLGVILNALQPLLPLLQRPVTAIALVGTFIGTFMFITFTLRAMLGLTG
jgi:membrane protein insertase Oxa1/YidC/SpoIIIJ